MKESSIELICNPRTHKPLLFKENFLIDPESGEKFPIKNGIPSILGSEELTGLNLKYNKLYNRIPFFYDVLFFWFVKVFMKEGDRERSRLFDILNIKDSDLVLDVSTGTGLNLYYSGTKSKFFGIDLSSGMIQRCRRNIKKWGIDAELFQANAEALPFKDGIFDVVTHCGGINFFNDRKKAIDEMIRVAKPGARFLICDETVKQIENMPKFLNRYYEKPDSDIYSAPVRFVPENMIDVNVAISFDGEYYVLTFKKTLKAGGL